MRNFKFLAGVSACAISVLAGSSAGAQTAPIIVQAIPLQDFCDRAGPGNPVSTQCATRVIGTRTFTPVGPPIFTVIPGGSNFVADFQVAFDGKLQIDGLNLQDDPRRPSTFFSPAAFNGTTVDLAAQFDARI